MAATSRATVTNRGTANTAPTLELAGPLVAPVVIVRPDNGSWLRYLDPVPAGGLVLVNVAERTVTLPSGTSRAHRAIVPDWNAFAIGPRATVDYAFSHSAAPNLDARLRVRWRDAYW